MTAERFPIEASHIMMFAYALGDDNPIYKDGKYAQEQGFENVLAPPTFIAADAHFDPDSELRRRSPGGHEDNGVPGDGRTLGLLAEQHYEYHRPLCAGEILSKSSRLGDTWEREGRRAGKLVFTETISEYRDQSGELIVTARTIRVHTERPVESSS